MEGEPGRRCQKDFLKGEKVCTASARWSSRHWAPIATSCSSWYRLEASRRRRRRKHYLYIYNSPRLQPADLVSVSFHPFDPGGAQVACPVESPFHCREEWANKRAPISFFFFFFFFNGLSSSSDSRHRDHQYFYATNRKSRPKSRWSLSVRFFFISFGSI